MDNNLQAFIDEFLQEYKIRYSKSVDDSIKKLSEMTDLHYNEVFDKSIYMRNSLTRKANYIVSEILVDKNINPDNKIITGTDIRSLDGVLYLMSVTVQDEVIQKFDDVSKELLVTLKARDFPIQNSQE